MIIFKISYHGLPRFKAKYNVQSPVQSLMTHCRIITRQVFDKSSQGLNMHICAKQVKNSAVTILSNVFWLFVYKSHHLLSTVYQIALWYARDKRQFSGHVCDGVYLIPIHMIYNDTVHSKFCDVLIFAKSPNKDTTKCRINMIKDIIISDYCTTICNFFQIIHKKLTKKNEINFPKIAED